MMSKKTKKRFIVRNIRRKPSNGQTYLGRIVASFDTEAEAKSWAAPYPSLKIIDRGSNEQATQDRLP